MIKITIELEDSNDIEKTFVIYKALETIRNQGGKIVSTITPGADTDQLIASAIYMTPKRKEQ